jgi:hypothetical protein
MHQTRNLRLSGKGFTKSWMAYPDLYACWRRTGPSSLSIDTFVIRSAAWSDASATNRFLDAPSLATDARRCAFLTQKIQWPGVGPHPFVILDDGIGFDPEQMHRTEVQGKGIGLAIMKERAGMLGGSFELHSEAGKETCITISIPSRDNGEKS